MPTRLLLRCATLALTLALSPLALFAKGKGFEKPVAQPARSYPAHDIHTDEKVGMAADPFDVAPKNELFPKNLIDAGFLPVFFVISNDGDQPVSIANVEITLITRNGSKLTPIAPDDIYRRLSNPQANTRPAPSPIPLPRRKVKGTVSKKEMDEIESALFAARAVEPHNLQSGFLFFDAGGIEQPLSGASIEITRVADSAGHELLYFELSMGKYLNAK
jgi:hypothetical protein